MAEEASPALKEAMQKFSRADEDKQRHKSRFDDCYRYALPWRHTLSTDTHTDPNEVDELVDATALQTVPDFAADMLATFTPRYVSWMEVKPVKQLSEEQLSQVQTALQDYQEVIFEEIARSNFYEAAEECYLDLACGTMSMFIQDVDPSQPIHCEAAASPDFWLLKGPFSSVHGRWRKRMLDAEDLPVLWPDADIPDALKVSTPGAEKPTEVTDGLHRDWSVKGTETWKYLVWTGNHLLLEDEFRGAGSNPLIVGRWLTDPTTAWGVGPLNQVLPWVRLVNDVTAMTMEQMEFAVNPAWQYDDDGVINFEQGLEPGAAVARAPGSRIEPLDRLQQFDIGELKIEWLREEIRRALFQDGPTQPGKTPPTATQWLDEAAKTARRMGSPAGRLIVEWQYPIFERFNFLLQERGVLPPVTLNDERITVRPVSPLMQALRQEELLRYVRLAELIAQTFGPQMLQAVVNPLRFIQKVVDILGIDRSVLNDENQIAQALEQAAALAQQGGLLPDAGGAAQ